MKLENISKSSLIPVTVVVPVKNEESNLPKCLDRLTRFAEVVVVDSSSTDSTPEIAVTHGAKYLNFQWDGQYPKKRNWLLINHPPENDWVLFLDADEFLDNDFCDELDSVIQSNKYNGFWLNYNNYFMGERMRYGVAQRKLALFRVDSGLYEYIDEKGWSDLDMEIHEHPIIAGAVGEINKKIEHNDYRGICKFIDRHKNYAMWEANRVSVLESIGDQALVNLTKRQKFKYQNISKWWYPWFYFSYTYFVKLGVFDGSVGFSYAYYKTWYFFTIKLLLSERRNS